MAKSKKSSKLYHRQFETVLKKRLKEPVNQIQAVIGPRQVGKTTGVLNVLENHFRPNEYNYVLCEDSLLDRDWFFQQLQNTRMQKKKIIVFDEIQKLDKWSELVKLAWDKQKREPHRLHFVLLGSSSLQLSMGLNESLAGRFEMIPVYHWSYKESNIAFNLSFEDYLKCGGYPGSYELINDERRFRQYLLESIFEAVIAKDILRYASIKKPALFRQTFVLVSQFPAQEISYNKLLGQLQEAGNVDQIKHYLDLLCQAFLLRMVFKWTPSSLSRTSSPKLLTCAPVFSSLFLKRELTAEDKGRIFEAVVGNRLCESFESVYFWREGNDEVDFVIETKGGLVGIEVKTKRRGTSGITAFRKKYPKAKVVFVDFENYLEFEKDPVTFLENYSL